MTIEVELGDRAHLVVDKEGLRDRRRVREPRGLDQDSVERAFALEQIADDTDQVAAHGAADAAVVHLEDFFVGVDNQLVIDADLAKFVDDHCIPLAVFLGEQAIEQRRLAGAEVAGKDGHRDLGPGSSETEQSRTWHSPLAMAAGAGHLDGRRC